MRESGMNGTIHPVDPGDRSTWPAPPGSTLRMVDFAWPAERTLRDGLHWPVPSILNERDAQAADQSEIAHGSQIYYFELDDFDGQIFAPVKIGLTVSLGNRHRGLVKDWGKMLLLATEPGGRALEQLRHWQFAACRMPAMPLPGGTEFFDSAPYVCPSLRAHINWLEEMGYGVADTSSRPFLPGMAVAA